MRKLLMFAGLTAMGLTATAQNNSLKIDSESSSISWRAEKITGSGHEGTVNFNGGYIRMDGEQIVGGKFIANMTSIAVTDLQGGMADKLAGHLNSGDFFNTAEFKTATFTFAKAKKVEGDMFELIGVLEIKGIQKPLKLTAKIDVSDLAVKLDGTTQIDRTGYDIKYGSSQFFEGIGDRAIKDKFDLTVSILAKKDA